MLELEVFNHDGNHTLRVWVRGTLIYKSDAVTEIELEAFRDALRNEHEWLSAYLQHKEENDCDHIWGLMHPINKENQKYVCLHCDEVKE